MVVAEIVAALVGSCFLFNRTHFASYVQFANNMKLLEIPLDIVLFVSYIA